MEKAKIYNIKLPKSMLDCINDDNIDNFIEGLSWSLHEYLKIVHYAKGFSKKSGKNTYFVKSHHMNYIDDGKQENSIVINGK